MITDTVIRQANPDDARELIKLFSVLYQESHFLLFEPGEFHLSLEEQKKLLEDNSGSKSWVLFVAENRDRLAGFLGGTGGAANRNRHTIQIAMGVRQTYQGKGIGHRLLETFFSWASDNHYHRIELTIMEDNENALSLYQSMGFDIEGLKRNSLMVNGSYVNEHFMAKLI